MKKGIIAFSYGETDYFEPAMIRTGDGDVKMLWEVFLKDDKGNYTVHYTVPKTQSVIRWLNGGGDTI